MRRPDLSARNRGAGGIYEDREWFLRRYEQDDRTFSEMAEEAGCSLRTIARWARLHDAAVPTAAEKAQRRGTSKPRTGRKQHFCGCGSPRSWGTATCIPCRDFTGERNPNYRGESIGVNQAHGRVKAARGSATEHRCQHCEGPAAHWAYDHQDPDERVSDDGPYSISIEHYLPLCVSCHKRFDLDYLRQARGVA